MIAAVEDISTTKKRLKIEIPTDVVEKEYKESLDKIRQRARIPGFREGKAPMNLIEKKFGGDIKADIIDRLVPDYYSKALKEARLVPVTLPKFESSLAVKRNEPLSFALTVEVRPNISDLNYTGLKVEDIPVQVDDKEVEETIRGLQEERAMFDVVEREIRADDIIVIDYIRLDPSGEKELSSAKDQVMNLGNNITPKGILDELIGRKKGEEVEISLPVFEGDEAKEGEAGNRLRITIKEVKEKKLPDIDNEFAKDFGYETLEALKEKVREGIGKAKKEKAAGKQKESLIETLSGSYDFDLPESLLEKEVEQLAVNERLSKKDSKEVLADAGGEARAQEGEPAISEEIRKQAAKNVRTAILLDMIAEKEGTDVSEEEVRTRIGLLAKHFRTTPENVINLFMTKDGSLDNLKRTIRDEKVMDLVLSKADIIKGA